MSLSLLGNPLSLKKHPFDYDLGIKVKHKNKQGPVTICCHGYGHCNEIVDVVSSSNIFNGPVVGFNFPDYGITDEDDHTECAYGTVDEILPLLYIIKQYAHDQQIPALNLYGFSAGGGAIINALAILNNYKHPQELQSIGITPAIAKQMLAALSTGIIVLDCPLKSIQEIIDTRGSSLQLQALAKKFTANGMNPLDALTALQGLALTVFLHFQQPDDILGNRDDALFAQRLKAANKGKTYYTVGNDGGHNGYHTALWNDVKKHQ